jgi:hypothetical protein
MSTRDADLAMLRALCDQHPGELSEAEWVRFEDMRSYLTENRFRVLSEKAARMGYCRSPAHRPAVRQPRLVRARPARQGCLEHGGDAAEEAAPAAQARGGAAAERGASAVSGDGAR